MNRRVTNTVLAVAIAGTNWALTACTPTGPKTNYASAPASAVGVSSVPASAAGPVPVDQIPPGNPASWVPAGVPTTAQWQEPGDTVPTFNTAIFTHNRTGALAAGIYYIAAKNWALATLDSQPFVLICDAAVCQRSAQLFATYRARGRHVVGARQTGTNWSARAASPGSGAEWVVEVRLQVHSGRLVDESGRASNEQQAHPLKAALLMSWSGDMWRVHDDGLAS